MSRVLITGSSGFLGGWLCRQAIDRGHTVAGTYHATEPDVGLSQVYQHTLPEVPTDDVAAFDPDIVINAAAVSSVEACEESPEMATAVNQQGSQRLAQLAADIDAMFVQVSTNFVFGKTTSAPFTEDDATDPVQVYGETKANAESAVQSIHPDSLVVRVSDIYGHNPSQSVTRHGFVQWLLETLRDGDSVSLVRDVYMSPTYVVSTATEILSLAERGASGIYHRTGASCVNRVEFGLAVAAAFDLDTSLINACEAAEIWNAPRPYCSCLSSNKLDDGIPATFESLEEGLARMKNSIDT